MGAIRALFTGQGKVAEAPVSSPAIVLPLGPGGGAGQRPNEEQLLGPRDVASIKGCDMMVDRYAVKMGLLRPITQNS